MSVIAEDVWLAGVDGCPGGWIAAFVRPEGEACEIAIFPRFADIAAVRPLLGQRQSSVFSVPSRAAIAATEYRAACEAALATSDPPRKVSKQLFNIAPKIREVDATLRADAQLAARTYEVHPELAFWRLNGGQPLTEPKKVRSRCYEPGLALRRDLLIAAAFPAALVNATPPKGAGPDDLLDALACAAVARRLHAGLARPCPDPVPHDAYGLPMAIWA